MLDDFIITTYQFETGFEGDWLQEMQNHFGLVDLLYSWNECGGGPGDAFYEIIPDPGNPDNKVLKFEITKGCCKSSDYCYGRVQANIITEQREVYHFKQKMYIGPDFNYCKGKGWLWLDLIEIWEDQGFSTGNGAGQAHFALYIENSSDGFCWRMCGEKMQPAEVEFEPIFSEMNYTEPPIGKRFDIDFYFERGEPGKVKIIITPEGQESYVLFDLSVPTTYPGHSRPVTYVQPLKWYLNKERLDDILAQGRCYILYDDFKELK